MKDVVKFLVVPVCMMALLIPLRSDQNRRVQRQQPEKLLDIAGIKPGMIVGEAGAGDGFLTFFISRRVGSKGHVYANDIDENALRRLNERCSREGVKNITTILGEVADPCFPVNNLDVITMIYAFHDFTENAAWLVNVKKYMKKNAAHQMRRNPWKIVGLCSSATRTGAIRRDLPGRPGRPEIRP